MDHPSARDLIEQCTSAPEPIAWGRFVERYGPVIEAGVRRALRRLGEPLPDGAELPDLVQECYCRLLERGCRRLLGLRGSADPEVLAWLGRFAERSARDRLKQLRALKRGGRRRRALSLVERVSGLPDPAGSPEHRAMRRQLLRQFARHCRRLTATDRDAQILRLVYFAGFTSREVAELSRGTLSPSSVDSVVYRFRRRLEQKGLPVPARAPARRRSRRDRRRRLQSRA